jgi:dTDP-4-dehydrorhamnose reductase
MPQSVSTQPLTEEYSAQSPLLVVGLPGVPGYNAFFYLRKLFSGRMVGIAPPNAPELMPFGPGIVLADPEKPEDIAALFEKYRFKTVVDATGWCALKPCEMDPALGRRLNVDVGLNIMREAKRAGARLIRLSTDLVFDGLPYTRDGQLRQGGYREDWPVSPVTMYGKFMAESETLILAEYPETAILRIALPMGPSLRGHAGAIDWIESRFRKGRPATLYFDEVRSSLYVQDLNRVIRHFITNGARGIHHVGGPLPLSLFQIAQVINKLGNYPAELLMGCPRAAAGPMPPRAGDVSMDTGKLLALMGPHAVRPWPFSERHVPSHPDWHKEREGSFPVDAIANELFGVGGPDAWDHPRELFLSAPGADGRSAPARAVPAR